MRLWHRLRSAWANLAHRDRVEASLDDELGAYADLLTAEYERRGYTPADARRAALVEIGGVTQVKESTRDAWSGDAFASSFRELRYTWRSLRRSPRLQRACPRPGLHPRPLPFPPSPSEEQASRASKAATFPTPSTSTT